jgi:putative transposase
MLGAMLSREGVSVGRRHVATLMRRMGISAIYRRPSTSKPAPGDKIYPYLLRGLKIGRVNQVWAMDIAYIPMARGFVYLAAVVDLFSRRVLAQRISITMENAFCVAAPEEALAKHGRPQIFNTDQGSQFTGLDFTGVLLEHGVAISINGKGASTQLEAADGRSYRGRSGTTVAALSVDAFNPSASAPRQSGRL